MDIMDKKYGLLNSRLRRLERGENTLRSGARVTGSGHYGRQLNSAFTNGRVDARNVISQGSIPVSMFPSFTGSVTDTSITWNWSGALRRADGSAVHVPASSLTISVLTPSTTYYFYPFYATKGCGVGFIGGDSGDPMFAHSAPTDSAAQQQNLLDREPLSSGAIFITTRATPGTDPITGGGSTGGTGGGHAGGCPRSYMVVESKLRGIVKCEELLLGERIASPDGDGWTDVTSIKLTPCDAFVCITTDAGDEIEISPETPQPLFNDDDKPANLLSLMDRAMVRQPGGGAGYITKLEYVETVDGIRSVIQCNPSHRFWCGRHSPVIAAHNINGKRVFE